MFYLFRSPLIVFRVYSQGMSLVINLLCYYIRETDTCFKKSNISEFLTQDCDLELKMCKLKILPFILS